MDKLIGRKKEKNELLSWLETDRSEFIAIYGRRRVGKTFLVRHLIKDNFSFIFSGSHGMNRKQQLLNFYLNMRTQFDRPDLPAADNWVSAFHDLKRCVEGSNKKKKIIFLDELPWIDTPKSGFVAALENFWNSWAAWRDDIKLIVCGSATSWIINKIIRNRGGLHNRVTHTLLIKPFYLDECEEYFKSYGFSFSRMQIAECYMTMGGIPYYFSLMDRGESLAQNIDRLFFKKDAPLANEFEDLYRALYKNYENHIKVIKALADKGIGLTRKEIIERTKLINNGEFSKILEELQLCGFIREYLPFSEERKRSKRLIRTSKDSLYQLIDFYSLFYLQFNHRRNVQDERFWSSMVNSPKLNVWRGLTFEMLCQYHIDKIKSSLGIADVSTRICAWRGEYENHKAQIDLLIDRKDDTINLCEMKFTHDKYVIDHKTAEDLQKKINIFCGATNTQKNILLTMITTKGITGTAASDIVQRQVTLDELF